MTQLFYAFTSLQLINMYNLKYMLYSNIESDLYIATGHRISPELIQSVYDAGIFRKIYVDNHLLTEKKLQNQTKDIVYSSNSSIINTFPEAIITIGRIIYNIFSNIHLKDIINSNNKQSKYNHIFIGTFGGSTPIIVKTILKINPSLKISIVEEGTVNYQRSLNELAQEYTLVGMKDAYYWLSKVFGVNRYFCLNMVKLVNTIYLYSPDSYNFRDCRSICKLPPINADNPTYSLLTSENTKLVISEYHNREFCYLLQDSSPCLNILLETILETIKPSNIIFREHPWHPVLKEIDDSIDLREAYIDTSAQIVSFESIINQLSTNQFVLITTDSSASLTPKYMFNKEPYIIYLYKLTNNRSKKDIENRDELICSLNRMYINKDRILIPQTIQELEICLQYILKRMGS